jgi:hypothetical protein
VVHAEQDDLLAITQKLDFGQQLLIGHVGRCHAGRQIPGYFLFKGNVCAEQKRASRCSTEAR